MEGPSPDAASPVGSFFANARKKMERVAENFDAQASKLLGPRKPARSCVPPEVYASFVKKLTHPDNALILEAMRVPPRGFFVARTRSDIGTRPPGVRGDLLGIRWVATRSVL